MGANLFLSPFLLPSKTLQDLQLLTLLRSCEEKFREMEKKQARNFHSELALYFPPLKISALDPNRNILSRIGKKGIKNISINKKDASKKKTLTFRMRVYDHLSMLYLLG
jgi:hypothetical protein